MKGINPVLSSNSKAVMGILSYHAHPHSHQGKLVWIR